MTSCIEKQEPAPFPLHELLADLRSGLTEEEVAAKYGLSPCIFEARKANSAEKQKGKSGSEERAETACSAASDATVKEAPGESSFICPACLTSFGVMFDICPNCSASVQEAMERAIEEQENIKIETREQESQPEAGSCSGGESVPQAKSENKPAAGTGVHGADAGGTAPPEIRTDDLSQKEAAAAKNASREAKSHVEAPRPAHSKSRARPIITGPQDMHRRIISSPSLRCESCQSTMTPALRDIYDRSRSLHALLAASVCFLIAFLCCVILSFFDGPSLSRISVFFFGSLAFLIGGILTGTGAFMYLAREKVYFCPRCKRTYPRADVSYLTAALVLSSKRAVGTL